MVLKFFRETFARLWDVIKLHCNTTKLDDKALGIITSGIAIEESHSNRDVIKKS